MKRLTIYKLIERYQENKLSDAQRQVLMEWYRRISERKAVFPDQGDTLGAAMLLRLQQEIGAPKKVRTLKLFWTVAASVLVLMSVPIIIWYTQLTGREDHASVNTLAIKAGVNKAILTLSDGSKVTLGDSSKGSITWSRRFRIAKDSNGQLVYEIAESSDRNVSDKGMNTVQTPNGGQYRVNLPDGTRVWLNAASSITFPLTFGSSSERRVLLTGEAYFEVAHNRRLPFRVITPRQTIQVLGTHFNVSAYSDEQSETTSLLEGAVKLSGGAQQVVLKPGEQANFDHHFEVHPADLEQAVAWKNGYFKFDDEPLESILRRVSRWYNIQVVYHDEALRQDRYSAVTTRFTDITTLFKLMEQIGNAHFKLEGNKVTVQKK